MASWQDIEGEAEYVRKLSEQTESLRVNVRRAIEAVLGPRSVWLVARRDLPPRSKACVRKESGHTLIKIARADSITIRWFGAHELGHVVLGHDDVRTEEDEAAANRFASALLMPWSAFRHLCIDYDHDLEPISKELGVSQTVAALRMAEVGQVPFAVVVAPDICRVQAMEQIELPTEEQLRRLSRQSDDELMQVGPGIRKAELTDATRRVVLVGND
jgi:Zn-dependent peptidase ImmA (M78 family)